MMMDTEMIMRLCNAAAGLYGVVHVRHLVQVVKQYGDRQLTRKELTELLQQQLPQGCGWKDGFLYCADVSADFEAWEAILKRRAHQPLCFLEIGEFLRYEDHAYVEPSAYLDALAALLGPEKPKEIKEVLMDCVRDMRRGMAPQEAMKRLLSTEVFPSQQELRRFGDLFASLYQTTRLYSECGFTLQEKRKAHMAKDSDEKNGQ